MDKIAARKCRAMALIVWIMGLYGQVSAQDSSSMAQAVQQLTSPAMHGRGYVKGGLDSAANYLLQQLTGWGLSVQQQAFHFPVNTFPGRLSLAINGKALQPGRDFIVYPASKSFKGSSDMYEFDTVSWVSMETNFGITRSKNLTWTVAQEQRNYAHFIVREAVLPAEVKTAAAEVDAVFIPSFAARNIIATIPGKRRPDSTLVFTAHYDHLGRMGEQTYFAGANDNASGVAMLLALAKRLKTEPLDYTVVFIFFAGEEAGMIGSQYYVKNPLLPLKQIRFLLNLDMMGTGDEGITVVNATVFKKEFALLQHINAGSKYFTAIESRGKAENSDHYYFTEKRVPSFFWYTMGERKAYHDVEDVAATLPFFEANDLMECILAFSKQVILLPKN